MEKIINGKLYDTDEAELIGTQGVATRDDFNEIKEWLYKTKNGRFFLKGCGYWTVGFAGQIYGRDNGDGCEFGFNLFAISERQARAFCEAYLSASVFREHFGDVEAA